VIELNGLASLSQAVDFGEYETNAIRSTLDALLATFNDAFVDSTVESMDD